MTFPRFSEIQQLGDDAVAGLPPLRLAVLRNIVVDQLVPYLRYGAWQEGFRAVCGMGEYDAVVQEAVGGAPDLLNGETDAVLVFTRLEGLSWELARNFTALSSAAIEAEVDRLAALFDDVLAGIRRQTPAMILWHALELPLHPAFGILDAQRADGQSGVIRSLNERLRQALQRHTSAYLVDLNTCIARVGAKAFYDARYWHAARAPYSLEGLREIATEDLGFLRAAKGRARKVLALDCDGVLWGGVVGEDGLAGIALGKVAPGSPYYELQQEALLLQQRGVLLALCSKNEAADVWEVFERHPDMVLKREHIAAHRINWDDKAASLRALAAELNVGLDSFVFADDSEFEINLIKDLLPEVRTLHLPSGRASEYRALLASSGVFDTLTISQEDKARGAAYQAESKRRELQASSGGDLQGYLVSLGMKLEIREADAFAIPRIAQLTQKTNQFNLTTIRYSDEDIRRLAEDPSADVLHLRYLDRFGDAGIVGVAILRYAGDQAVIDSYMLSCRVLGRGVERAFAAHCLLRARQRGMRTVSATYRPTAKNAQVREFYPSLGFAPAGATADGTAFQLDLETWTPDIPDTFAIDSVGATADVGARTQGIAGGNIG
jgi:FkbH-like protein